MPPCAFDMIDAITLLRHAVGGIGRRHDPFLKGHKFQPLDAEVHQRTSRPHHLLNSRWRVDLVILGSFGVDEHD
jgi:hypothetical protein